MAQQVARSEVTEGDSLEQYTCSCVILNPQESGNAEQMFNSVLEHHGYAIDAIYGNGFIRENKLIKTMRQICF